MLGVRQVFIISCIFTTSVLADVLDGWRIFPKSPVVLYKGTLRLELRPPKNFRPEMLNYSCQAASSRWRVLLDANNPGVETAELIRNLDHVELGRTSVGGCYLIHSTISTYGEWDISTANHKDSSHISIVKGSDNRLTTIRTSIGHKATIDCSFNGISSLDYCQILNTTDQVVSNDCKYTIDPVRSEHAGLWFCFVAFTGTMESYKLVASLYVQDSSVTSEGLENRVFTEGDRTYLQCEVINKQYDYKWCRAISPQGQSLNLSPGLVMGRYSAIYTNIRSSFDKNICSLEIENLTNSDHGLWRIEMGISENDYIGCFINVPDTAEVALEPLHQEPTQTRVKVGGKLRIMCNVPWPVSHCYAIRPNGTVIRQNDDAADHLASIGTCILTVPDVTVEDSGRWTCSLPSNDGTENKHFYTEVDIISDRLISAQKEVSVDIGKPAELLCRSHTLKPLKYCEFISPNGKRYSLTPNATSKSRFSYFGAGLEDGECGVKIGGVTDEDVGNWTCATTLKSFNTEESTTITVIL